MPAPTFVGDTLTNADDVSTGVTTEEAGILTGDIDYSIDNPKVEFMDRYGGIVGKAVNHNATLSLTITGEVLDVDATDAITLQTYTAAATLVNGDFFASSGSTHHGIDFLNGAGADSDFVLDDASGSQPRGGARTVSCTFLRHLGLTIA